MALDRILFNDVSLGRLLGWLVGVVALCLLVKLYKSMFVKKKINLQHTVYFACSHCGWEGHISKFGTRCPKCDAATGDLSGR